MDNGLNLTMVPDPERDSSSGYDTRSGVGDHRRQVHAHQWLRPGQGQDVQCVEWWLAGHLVHRPQQWERGPGDRPARGGFHAGRCRDSPAGTPENNIFVSTYHTASGSQSGFGYATPTAMNAGYNTYGMEYLPGRSIKTYFNGTLVGSWTKDISTTPYEIVIWNSQAASNTSGYHTVGSSPDPSEMSIAEVQVYSAAT